MPDVLDTIAEEEPSHSNTTWMVQRSWLPHFSPEALAVAGVSSSASGELHLGDGPAVAGPEWYWRQMICHLDADSMNRVVHGPESRSRGIIGCWFSPRPGSYDHVRANQNKGGDRLPIWDFQVLRDDGTCIYLHPPWKGNKIDATEDTTEGFGGVAQFVSLPKHGHGQSDGRGTFQSYKKQQRSVQLKFASPSELNSGVCNSSESKSEVRIDFTAMDE